MLDDLRDDRDFRVLASCAIAAALAWGVWCGTTIGERGLIAAATLIGSLPFLGKFLIFTGLAATNPLKPIPIASLSLIFDFAIAVALSAGLSRFENLPLIGKGIASARTKAHEVLLRYPGLRRMAFWGVALFVFLPLPASGAVGGTFAGVLFGLPRTSRVIAITLGSAAVTVVFTTLALVMGNEAESLLKNPWLGVAGFVVFALFGWWAYHHAKKILQRQ